MSFSIENSLNRSNIDLWYFFIQKNPQEVLALVNLTNCTCTVYVAIQGRLHQGFGFASYI